MSFPRPLISFIIPVYNRPEEVQELLQSLCLQHDKRFEVIIIEDGSHTPCKSIVEEYSSRLSIVYKYIENGGPARARNIGAQLATSDLLVFLDSDVVLPAAYTDRVIQAFTKKENSLQGFDVFGGADCAADSFTPVQKAINYAMTSPLTTGGIRGGKKHIGKYYPRTFNMGCRRLFFDKVQGFDESMRFGEDIDFGLRLEKCGAHIVLLQDAWVYHKRRVDFRKFFKQVFNSGMARMTLSLKHKGSLKLVHLLPSIATITLLFFLIVGVCICPWALTIPLLGGLIIFIHACIQTKSLWIALLSLPAVLIQICGYGAGFLAASIKRLFSSKASLQAFDKSFYN